jgi:hypothetical protein
LKKLIPIEYQLAPMGHSGSEWYSDKVSTGLQAAGLAQVSSNMCGSRELRKKLFANISRN